MPAGDLITLPYQAELRGVLMGAGTDYPFVAPHGGFGLPDLRTNDTPRPQAHGVFPGPDYMDARRVTLEVAVLVDTPAQVEEALIELGAAFAPITDLETVPLVFTLASGDKYWLDGRPRRMATNLERLKNATGGVVMEFVAVDPRIYTLATDSGSTQDGTTTGGLGFPHGFPHGFGASEPGIVTAITTGNLPVPFTFRVTAGVGGLSSFTVRKSGTDELFGMTITLAEGDYVDVDTRARTAKLNGTASRVGNIDRPDSVWLELDPGVNVLTFASSGAGSATFEASWYVGAFNI